MPKQPKKGLNYFTLDCDIFSTKSGLKPLIDRYQADGLAVYIHILCDVYATGYYFKPDNYEDYLYAMAKDIGISVEKVQLILAFMADRTLLDAFSLNKNTVFTSHGIQKRYVEAMKGRKRNVAEIKGEHWLLSEKDERELDTFYKRTHCADKSEKMTDKSEKIDDKSEIYSTTEQNIYIYPPLPPEGGVGKDDWEKKFFSSYPKLKGLEKYKGINYAALCEHFEKSEFLRTRFSAKWVYENYQDILNGEHDDKPSTDEYIKARREWYSARREKAISISERNKKRAEESNEFRVAEKTKRTAEIRIAKAEAESRVDDEAVSALKNANVIICRELTKIGLKESDLVPQWHCTKCSDTGFLPDGRPCDCYEVKHKCQLKMI